MARRTTSNKQLTELLRKVPLFSSCTNKELAAIAGAGKSVRHEAGYVICHEGQTGHGLHVVIAGETRVEVGGRTRRRLGPGAFFGEIALLDRGPRTATVVAETPVETFVLPVWNFRSIVKAQPGLAFKLLEEVCRRVRSSETSLTH
jgi:CRP/FNR family transcriptional regulator